MVVQGQCPPLILSSLLLDIETPGCTLHQLQSHLLSTLAMADFSLLNSKQLHTKISTTASKKKNHDSGEYSGFIIKIITKWMMKHLWWGEFSGCMCVCVCSVMSYSLGPLDCSLPDSPVHRIFQVKILEWVAISFSRGSSWPRDRTQVSSTSCIDRQILYHWVPWEALGFLYFNSFNPQEDMKCVHAHMI